MFLYCKLLLGNLGFVSVSYLREIAEDDSTLIGGDIKLSSNTKQRLLLRYFEPAVLMVGYQAMNVLLCRLLIIISFKVYIIYAFVDYSHYKWSMNHWHKQLIKHA